MFERPRLRPSPAPVIGIFLPTPSAFAVGMLRFLVEKRDAALGWSTVPWMVYDILIRRSSYHLTLAITAGSGTAHRLDWMSQMEYPIDHEGWSAVIQKRALVDKRWPAAE